MAYRSESDPRYGVDLRRYVARLPQRDDRFMGMFRGGPPDRNWLFPTTKEMLTKTVPRDTQVIIELGSLMGRSTRFLLEHAPQATVLAVDHWQGSGDMQNDAEVVAILPRLYETFLAECWP